MTAALAQLPPGHSVFLFDFDGTIGRLVLDWNAVRRAVVEVLRSGNSALWPPCGISLKNILAEVEDSVDSRNRSLVAQTLAQHESRAEIEPIPAGVELLRQARLAGPTAIVSNNSRVTVARGLVALGVNPSGLVLVGFEDVGRCKPAPEGLLLALERLGRSAAGVLFVGDKESDRLAAHAAGIAFRHIDQLQTASEVD